jgi:hypothetical protein
MSRGQSDSRLPNVTHAPSLHICPRAGRCPVRRGRDVPITHILRDRVSLGRMHHPLADHFEPLLRLPHPRCVGMCCCALCVCAVYMWVQLRRRLPCRVLAPSPSLSIKPVHSSSSHARTHAYTHARTRTRTHAHVAARRCRHQRLRQHSQLRPNVRRQVHHRLHIRRRNHPVCYVPLPPCRSKNIIVPLFL